MTAAPLTITSLRERHVNFVKPFLLSGHIVVMNKESGAPFPVSGAVRVFAPLSTGAWIVLYLLSTMVRTNL